MKYLNSIKNLLNTRLVILTFLVLGGSYLNAQVIVPFTQRTAAATPGTTIYSVKGDFRMIGNTSLVKNPYDDFDQNGNNNMEYVDIDNVDTTLNSSSAVLALSRENGAIPECSEILFAGLYWSGRADNGSANTTFQVTKSVPGGVGTPFSNNLSIEDEDIINNTSYELEVDRVGSNNDYRNRFIFTSNAGGALIEFDFLNTVPYIRYRTNGGAWIVPTGQSVSNSGNDRTVTFNPVAFTDPNGNTITFTSLVRDSRTNRNDGQYEDEAIANVTVSGLNFGNINVTKTFDKRKVSIKGPNSANYSPVVADANDIWYPVNSQQGLYVGYAEVTDYVKANGLGEYFVADVATREGNGGGTGYYGGWGMVVVYENYLMEYRDVTIFDGYSYMSTGGGDENFNISGFQTAQNGDIDVKIGVMGGEGDRGIAGDFIQVRRNSDNVFQSLSHSGNSATNFFNSSIYQDSAVVRNPTFLNNYGSDLSSFYLDNTGNQIFGNNQTSTTFRYGTNGDLYIIYNLALSVSAYIPEIEGVLTVETINGAPAQNPLQPVEPGGAIDYELTIRNSGAEAIDSAVFTFPIPYSASFVPGSITTSVLYTPLPTPNNAYFDPNLGPNGSVVWDLGLLPLPANPQDLLGTLNFSVTAMDDCYLLNNISCANDVPMFGEVTGVGQVSGQDVGNGSIVQGFDTTVLCTGNPIFLPVLVDIDPTNFIDTCTVNNPVINGFTFLQSGGPLPVSAISAEFRPGTRFYSSYPVTGSTIEYTNVTLIPNTLGTTTYYAVAPGSEPDCFYVFTITFKSIDANNDAAGPINGLTGATNVVNIYTNDLLNNVVLNPADVTTTIPVPDPSGVLTLLPNGNVNVAPNSPAGTYTLSYQICENAFPTNCDIGVVTVSVNPAVINAVNNSYTCINGIAGSSNLGNVIANDQLNGAAVSASAITLTTTTPDPSGRLTVSAAGVASLLANTNAGTYTLTYRICENLNPSNCDNATVTVTVSPVVGGPTAVCSGSTINLTPSSGGTWASNNNSIATVNNSGLVTGGNNGTAVLTFTQTSTGCTATRTITVNALPVLGGATSICVGSTGNVTPATGGTWTSSNNAIATVNNSGLVTGNANGPVTLTFTQTSTGCSSTRVVTINSLPVLGGATSVCVGGTANVTPSSGGTWTSSNNTLALINNSGNISGLAAGTVTLTYTNSATNCSSTRTLVINPLASLSGLNTTCSAVTNTYTVSFTLTGTGPYTATGTGAPGTWTGSNWTSGPIAVGTAYNINARDVFGCNILNVSNPSPICDPCIATVLDLTVNTTDATTSGACANGTATAVTTGGLAPYSYAWTGGLGNNATANNISAPGTYTVVVTDANGCDTSANVSLVCANDCDVSASLNAITPVLCNGGNTGIATVSASSVLHPGGPFVFTWRRAGSTVFSSVGTSSTFNSASAGNYTVEVTLQGLACPPVSVNVVMTQPNLLSAGAAVTSVACNGQNTGAIDLSVSGGTAPYTYIWSNGPTTQDLSGLVAGTYNVVVTDANGCTVPLSATVNQPTNGLAVNITKTDALSSLGCNNGTALANVSGGTPPYTYLWSSGLGSNSSATGMTGPGTYSLLVTDNNGCTLSQSVTIDCVNDCDAVVGITSVTDVACNGESTGAATVSASSAAHPGGPFTFEWRQGATTVFTSTGTSSTLSNVSAGVYIVSVSIDGTVCQDVEQSVSIGQPTNSLSANATTQQNQQSIGGTEGAVSVTASGGTPPYSYQWGSNAGNATTQSVSGLLPGNYCVTVTDANGCVSGLVCTTVNPFTCISNPVISFNVTNVSCNGLSNGAIMTMVNGGTGPYTYTWTGAGIVQGNPNQSNLAAGTYGVTVVDATGCQSQSSITITQPNALSAGVAVTNVQCNGANTGALNLTVNGGTTPYTFSWNNGPVTEDQSSLPAGNYTVDITDANGCTTSISANIVQPANALNVSISATDALLSAGCGNGSATATVSGGTPPYTYAWNDGASQTTATATALTGTVLGSNYTVTVTDANGCSSTGTATINCTDNCGIAIVVNSTTNILCRGNSTGATTITASNAANPSATFNFSWSNGFTTSNNTTSSLIGIPAGTYNVSVSIVGTSCPPVTQSITITEPANDLAANVSGTNETSLNGNDGTVTATPSGGTAAYTYAWTGPAGYTSPNAVNTNLVPGNYCVTVTDANGCTATGCYNVSVYACATTQPVLDITTENVSCNGLTDGSIAVNVTNSASVPSPITYSWVPSVTTGNNATNLAAGSYSVTVTGADGCFTTANAIIVTQPAVLSGSIDVTSVLCNNDSTGALDLTVSGGTAPYTYLWSNAAVTEDLTGLSAGTYNVLVTDSNGCTFNPSGIITEPSDSILVNLTGVDALSTQSCANGSVTSVVTGGTGPYTYSWSGGLGTNPNLASLSPGTYTLTVTDANGCTAIQNVTIACTNNCDAILTIDSQTNVLCNGDLTGSISATASSVISPAINYNFSWTGGFSTLNSQTSILSNAPAGTYTVTATQIGTSCPVLTQTVTLTQPTNSLAANVTGTSETGLNFNDGSASASPTGGTGPYTYAWTGPSSFTSSNASNTGLIPGNYCVTITDANGCTDAACYNVLPYVCTSTTPDIVVTISNVSCNGGNDGSAVVNVINAASVSAPISYAWTGTSPGNVNTASSLAAGSYSVVVTGADGCFVPSNPITITQPATLVGSIAATNVLCSGGNTGTLDFTISGGTAPYAYSWNNGPITEDQNSLAAGTYSVTATDARGCSITRSATITEPLTALSVSINSTNASTTQSCSNATASAIVSGGTGPYTYSWSNSLGSNPNLVGLSAGTYTVTVTDANGCSANDNVTITCLNDCDAILTVNSQTNILCRGDVTGGAIVGASSVIYPATNYNFAWSNGFTTSNAQISNLTTVPAGTYTVTATQIGTNCPSLTQSVTITEPTNNLSANVSGTNESSLNGNNGTVTASPLGGTAGYTYFWTGPNGFTSTSAANANLEPGNYCVTVTDANGCTAVGCYNVTVFVCATTVPLLSVTIDNVSCNGLSDGEVIVNITNAANVPGPLTYTWTPNVSSNNTASNLGAGNYALTITGGDGCFTTSNPITVTQPAALTGSISATPVLCNGASTGQLDFTINGGTPPYNYVWTNTSTSQDLVGLSAGTYTVVATDANGCSITRTGTVTQPASQVSVSIVSADALSSQACANGTAAATATGGTAPYSYSWSGGLGTNPNLAGLSPGSYVVTVTDANGCITTGNVSIICTDDCDATVNLNNQVNVLCRGELTGSVIASASSTLYPSNNFNFAWSNGFNTANAQSSTLNAVGAGLYTVTVTQVGTTCPVLTQSVTITQPANNLVANVSGTNESILNGNNGTVTAAPSGGTPGYNYSWTGPSGYTSTSASNTGLAPGDYCVTVVDFNGCSATGCYEVLPINCIPTAPQLAITVDGVSCNGFSDGEISVNVTNASSVPGLITYDWTPNVSSTNTASNLIAGNYSVTVTGGNFCFTTSNVINVPQPAALTGSIATTDVLCFGAAQGDLDFTINGGTPPYTYLWSNNVTTQDLLNVTAGTYTVNATDANGCSISRTATINQPATPMTVFPSSTPPLTSQACSNGSAGVSVTGGTPPYTYLWSNSLGTDSTILGLSPGNYSVTVTDGNGCTITASITLVCENDCDASLAFSGQNNVLCRGDLTGSVTATASSVIYPGVNYNFAWSNGFATSDSQTSTLSGVAAGTYTVTATQVGTTCPPIVRFVTITQPSNVLLANVSGTNQTLFNVSNGSVSSAPTGGTGPYTYAWTGPSGYTSSNATNIGLAPGNYCVTVTDFNGCTATGCYNILPINCIPTAPQLSITVDSVSCNGFSDGEISVNVTNASSVPGLITYAWTPNVSSTNTASNLIAGNYSVTVTGGNFCFTTSNVINVQQPAALTGSIATTDVLCFGAAQGNLDFTINGGTPPYTYLWSNNVTTQDLVNVTAGTYTVNAVDANGCTISRTATISEPDSAIAINIASTNALFSQGCANGTASATITGGTPPYTLSWSNGLGTNASVNNLSSQSYTLTVTDANGCIRTQGVTIACTQDCDAQVLIDSVGDVLCHGQSTGSAIAIASSLNYPNATYNFTWSNGFQNFGDTISSITNVPAGSYTVTATLAGTTCPGVTQAVTITQPVLGPIVATVSGTSQTILNVDNGTAEVSPSGGTAPYTISWTGPNGFTSSALTISGLEPGNYCATVTDANGCEQTNCYNVTSIQCTVTAPQISLSSTNITCNGAANGTATVVVNNISAVIPIVTYSWSPSGGSSNTATNLAPGTYSVTVTGGDGCFTTSNPVIITQPTPLNGSIGVSNVTCNGGSNGAMNTSVSGGTFPYTYAWSSGSTSANITNLSAGSDTVVITDANGCSITRFATVTEPVLQSIDAIVNVTDPDCGLTNGSFTLETVLPNSTWVVNYSRNGAVQSASLSSNASGQIIVNNLSEGTYTNFQLQSTITGCLSNIFAGPITLTEIPAPVYTEANVSITNASSCSTCNGALTVTGLPASTSITVSYFRDLVAVSPGYTATTSSTGVLVIPNLCIGDYTNLVVTNNATTCVSLPILGPLTIEPINPLGFINGEVDTICLGASTTLTSSVNEAGVSVYWRSNSSTGPLLNGGAPSPSLTVSPSVTTFYTAEFISNSGCTELDTITVYVDDAPIPVNDGCFTVVEDSTYDGTLSADFTANDDLLGVLNGAVVYDVVSVQNGTMTINNALDSYNYTPNFNFSGYDTAFVRTCNAECPSLCNTFAVCFLVDPVTDTLPITTPEDVPITVCAPVISDMGPGATYNTCDGNLSTSNGTVNFTTVGCITYIPNTNYVGDDEICLVVCNNGICDTTFIPVVVTPVTDTLPLITEQETPITVCAPAITVMSASATYNICDAPDNGIVTFNTPGCVTYEPGLNYVGYDTACIVVCDMGVCDTTILTIIVTPVIDTLQMVTPEDVPFTICVPTITDMGAGATYATCNGPLTTENGTISFDNTGCVTYQPNQNFVGLDTACIVICNSVFCDVTYIEITVTPVTDTLPITTPEDVPVTVCVPDISDMGPGATYETCNGDSLTSNGTVTFPTFGCLTYTPNPNYVGDDELCLVVCNNGVCDTTFIPITVTPVTDTLPITTPEDVPVTVCVPAITDMGIGATYETCNGDTLTVNGVVSIDSTTQCITYTPNTNYVGEDTICLVVCNNGICDTTFIPITVTPVTDTLPIITPEDVPVTVCVPEISDMGLGATYETCNGDSLTANGTVTFPTFGCLTYTPNPNYVGEDELCLVVCNNGICDTTFIPITVTPVTDTLPITTPEDVPVTVCVPEISDMGPGATYETCNGDSLTANGTVTFPIPGCLTYTPNPNYVGNDEICLVVCNNGICDTTILPVTVTPVWDTLIVSTPEDTPIVICVPAITDMGIGATYETCDGDSLTVNGTVTIDSTTQCITYTPNTNFSGEDTICLVVCNNGICDTTSIPVTVTPVTDTLPIITPEDVPVTVCVPEISDMGPGATYETCNGDSLTANGTVTFPTFGCLTYTPNPNYIGEDELCLVVCNNGICDTTFIPITVTPVTDTLPITTPEDVPVTVCVPDISDMGPGATYETCNGDSLTLNGTVTFPTFGCLTYTPNPNYVGEDEICLVVCNNGICDTTILPVTVTPVTDTLIVTTPEDTPVVICVPAITDMGIGASYETCDGDSLTMNGIITIDSTTQCITYTPFTNFNGEDTLCLVVCNNGICDTTTIVVIVTPVNDPPVAIDDINTTIQDIPVSGSVAINDFDVDGDNLTYGVLVNVPTTIGQLTFLPDGSYDFAPNPGFIGTTTFTYYVCDDGVPTLCDTAVAVIIVLPNDPYVLNNPPVASNDNAVVNSTNPFDLCIICNDFDPDGDVITVTSISPNGFTVVDNGNGTVTITPPAGSTDTTIIFEYVICDDANPALCDTATVTIQVLEEPNTGVLPPFAIDDAFASDGSPVSDNVLTNDLNPQGGALTVSQISNPTNGTVILDPVTGNFTYTPNPGYEGPDQFVYEICDAFGNCDQATVYIIVINNNNPPIAINDVNHTFNGLPVNGDVSTNDMDPDNDPVDFTLIDDVDSMSGVLDFNSDGTYTFTPEPGFTGTATFTYTICDDGGLCDTALVVIDVDLYDPNTNNPPTAINDNLVTYAHPVAPATISICAICNDSDPDGDLITATLVPNSGPDNGVLVDNGDGTYDYTPNPGFIGTDQFTYVVCDPDGLCDTAVVTVNVLYNVNPNSNHPPFATDDYFTTQLGVAVSGQSVLPNDFDIDGDSLTVTLVNDVNNGTLVLNADGTFTYTPNEGFAGEDQFTYQLCDDGSPVLCDMATVYITVVPDPVIAVDDYEFVANTEAIDIDILDNDTYSAGETSVNILIEPIYGSVVVNGDGSVTYYPSFVEDPPVDSFQYVLCVNGICDTAWVVLEFQLELVIPDGISPNGDGRNDVFIIENLLNFYPNATIVMYNRWGDEVWNSYGPYQNNWNGINFQNVPLTDGTYFYILDYKDGVSDPKQGFVGVYRQK